jgi:hypothetical protein
MRLQRKPAGFLANWIDAVFFRLFGQRGHCAESYWTERPRGHLPPELRG